MTDSLSKYFASEIRIVKRSEINPATYNPRTISKEGVSTLKRSLNNYGVLGGIIVNQRTGMTIVGGHQKVAILDRQFKYPDNDYELRVEVIDVDLKTEKTINIALNNPNVGGDWDFDKMREIIPDIDYKDAGLTDADLSYIGVDFLLQTEGETAIANDLDVLMAEERQRHEAEKARRQAEREAEREILRQQAKEQAAANSEEYVEPEFEDDDEDDDELDLPPIPTYGPTTATVGPPPTAEELEAERQAKIQAVKDVKRQVAEKAAERAADAVAYITLSFDNFEGKAAFCQRFGFSPYDKFIKGEMFDEMVERID